LHGMKLYVDSLRLVLEASLAPAVRRERRRLTEALACAAIPPACTAPDGSNAPFDIEGGFTRGRRATTRVWGDPHCNSLDNRSFECNFKGEAVWASCADWSVHVAAHVAGTGGGTVLSAVAVRKRSEVVRIVLDESAAGNAANESANETGVLEYYSLFLDDEEVGANVEGTELLVYLDGDTIYIEDTARTELMVLVTLKESFISALGLRVGDDCVGQTVGLVGNGNGNATDDLWPKGASEPLRPESACRDIYHDFVLSWCITELNESLLGLDSLCDADFKPVCGDELDSEVRENCIAACNGREDCCFDQLISEGDATMLAASLESFEVMSEELATSYIPGGPVPPRFAETPTRIWVPPWEVGAESSMMAYFEAAHDEAVANLTCTICTEAPDVECVVHGVGTTQARLEIWAPSLPEGDITCTATDPSGRPSSVLTEVSVQDRISSTSSVSSLTSTSSSTTTTGIEVLLCNLSASLQLRGEPWQQQDTNCSEMVTLDETCRVDACPRGTDAVGTYTCMRAAAGDLALLGLPRCIAQGVLTAEVSILSHSLTLALQTTPPLQVGGVLAAMELALTKFFDVELEYLLQVDVAEVTTAGRRLTQAPQEYSVKYELAMPQNMSTALQLRAVSLASGVGASNALDLLSVELLAANSALTVLSKSLTADSQPLLFRQELAVGADGKPLRSLIGSTTTTQATSSGPTSRSTSPRTTPSPSTSGREIAADGEGEGVDIGTLLPLACGLLAAVVVICCATTCFLCKRRRAMRTSLYAVGEGATELNTRFNAVGTPWAWQESEIDHAALVDRKDAMAVTADEADWHQAIPVRDYEADEHPQQSAPESETTGAADKNDLQVEETDSVAHAVPLKLPGAADKNDLHVEESDFANSAPPDLPGAAWHSDLHVEEESDYAHAAPPELPGAQPE